MNPTLILGFTMLLHDSSVIKNTANLQRINRLRANCIWTLVCAYWELNFKTIGILIGILGICVQILLYLIAVNNAYRCLLKCLYMKSYATIFLFQLNISLSLKTMERNAIKIKQKKKSCLWPVKQDIISTNVS